MKILTEEKAEKFLGHYVPVAKSKMAKNISDVKKYAKHIGYPLVLKIISERALHKTEIGGVRIVTDNSNLQNEYNLLMKIVKQKKIKISGIYIQEYVEGKEVVIGLKKDSTFGHAIMFGIGGKYVELIKDVVFRICPINSLEARQMINDLHFRKILEGFRGERPINFNFLEKTISSISKIPIRHKNIEELDINPLIVNEKDGKVVDARIVFS